MFQDLNARRLGEMTSQPITYAELHAYLTLMDDQLQPWEVEIVIAIDNEFLSFLAEQKP